MARAAPQSRFSLDPASAPAVSIFTVAAIAVFVADLAKKDTSPLVLDVRAFMGEPWRIATTALPHANILHLAFNLLWLVRLGVPIEKRVGTLRFLLFALVVDAGASVAEYALAGSAVGLSGVGYGLVAFGWVARHDPRFAGIVDRRTAGGFVTWFFFCIVLTLADAMPVANVAHGVGALLGALLAVIATRRALALRIGAAAVGVALLGASWLGATTYRPLVNITKRRDADSAYLGWKLLDAEENAAALPFLQEAVRMKPTDGGNWHNLGIALRRLDRVDESIEAYRRAYAVEGTDERRDVAARALLGAAAQALEKHDHERMTRVCTVGLDLKPGDAELSACLQTARSVREMEEQVKAIEAKSGH